MIDKHKEIIKARTSMIMEQSFFASLAMMLELIEDKEISTIATNGKNLRYSLEFIKTLKYQELVFTICHEVLHCVFGHVHINRLQHRNKMVVDLNGNIISLANIAQDYVINGIIKEMIDMYGYRMSVPIIALIDSRFNGMCWEEVYDILDKEIAENDEFHGGLLDDHSEFGKGNSSENEGKESEENSQKWKDAFKRALTKHEMNHRGKLPLGLSALNDLLFKPPKINWRSALQDKIQTLNKHKPRILPPSRRHRNLGLMLPSYHGEHIKIGFAIDTSGSMISMISEIIQELNSIISIFDSWEIHTFACDSEVHSYNVIENSYIDDTLIQDLSKGGGGTSFIPVFDRLEEEGVNLNLLIYATDGYGEFPKEPDVDTLWLALENTLDPTNYPFGNVIVLYSDQ
jgi:predicted metal-dependent peptidase